jgi:tripartite-type tricarboxylate transporter receptor subunit TctC
VEAIIEKTRPERSERRRNIFVPTTTHETCRISGARRPYFERRLVMVESVMKGRVLRSGNGGKTVRERKPAGRSRAAHRAFITAVAIVGAVLLIGAMAAPLCAQTYPDRPIRFILPFAPGGTTDILGRIIGVKLAERLGQSVVPENRAGAGGNVGTEFTAKARPDGYTIVLASSGHSISPSLYKKLNYDPIKDFVPVSLVAQVHQVLLVNPSLPVKNLKELVEYAKANPGKLNFGTGGIGTTPHLAWELLKSLTKINIVVVPYKSEPQVMTALLGSEVDMMVITPDLAMAQIQAGKVRALTVLSKERLPSLPDVPTAKEAGVDNWEVTIWYGMLAPAGTPRDIINRLNTEWVKIAAMPETREQLQKAGFETLSCTPEQFSESLKAEKELWAKVTKEANIFGIY